MHLDEAWALPCAVAGVRQGLAFLGFPGVAGDGGSQARGEDPDRIAARRERAGQCPETQRGGRRLGCKGAGREGD